VQARKFQLNYPCFVLVPQTNGSWDNDKLINLIEDFKKNHRIDLNRVYLIGYSMGGSGSYSLANAYYQYNKHLFAGIIRLAGQSQTTLEDSIVKHTSVWLHIGLKDSELRIQVTRDAYDFLKSSHLQAIETTSKVNISPYSGTTVTLTENGLEIVKKTEYNNVGHSINNLPFADEYLLKWLFSQEVK
jgi:predicted peptidase